MKKFVDFIKKNKVYIIIISLLIVVICVAISLLHFVDFRSTEEIKTAKDQGYTVEKTIEVDMGDNGTLKQNVVTAPIEGTGALIMLELDTEEQAENYLIETVKAYTDANNFPDPTEAIKNNGCYACINDDFYYVASLKGNIATYSMVGVMEATVKATNKYMESLGFKVPEKIEQQVTKKEG